MSKRRKQGWMAGTAKWIGLQFAAQAVRIGLGTPFAAAVAMGMLAWLDGFPLAYGFLSVIIVSAATATALNQARAFLLSYSVEGKFDLISADVERAITAKDEQGYGVALIFRNSANIPLEYIVDRVSLHLNGRVVDQTPFVGPGTSGGVVPAGDPRRYQVGVVPGVVTDENIFGELEITYSYGRPGRMGYSETRSGRLQVVTDPEGVVLETRLHS